MLAKSENNLATECRSIVLINIVGIFTESRILDLELGRKGSGRLLACRIFFLLRAIVFVFQPK